MRGLFLLLGLFFSVVGMRGQIWTEDYDRALSQANNASRPILLVFSGSDWCAPCIRLDREIWQSDFFRDHANAHWVLYKADFPRRKSNKLSEAKALQNEQLAERYNPKGFFPLIVVMDKDQKVLGTMGYEKIPPKEYISRINALTE